MRHFTVPHNMHCSVCISHHLGGAVGAHLSVCSCVQLWQLWDRNTCPRYIHSTLVYSTVLYYKLTDCSRISISFYVCGLRAFQHPETRHLRRTQYENNNNLSAPGWLWLMRCSMLELQIRPAIRLHLNEIFNYWLGSKYAGVFESRSGCIHSVESFLCHETWKLIRN